MTAGPVTVRGLMRSNRRFMLLWVAQVVCTAGQGVANLVLPIYLLHQGTSRTLGYYLAATTFATMVFLPVGGALADRYPRGVLVRGGYLVTALAVILLMTGGGQGAGQVMIAAGVLSGCGWGLSMPASRSMVVDFVEPDQIERAQSLIGASQSVLYMLGPALGGLLLIVCAPRTLLIGEAGALVAAAGLVPRTRGTEPGADGAAPRERFTLGSAAAGLRAAWRVPWVIAGSLQTTIQVLLAFAPGFVLLRYVGEPRYGEAGLGVILAASGVADMLGTLVAGRWKPARPGLWANIGFMSFAGVQLCLAASVPLPVFCVAIVVGTFGIGFHGIWWYGAINRRFAPRMRGRINALDSLSGKLLEPIGMAAAIPVANSFGVTSVALTGLGVFLIVPLLALLVPGLARYADTAGSTVSAADQELVGSG